MKFYHTIGYIILFLPLICAFAFLLVNFRRHNFAVFCASHILVLLCAGALIFRLPNFQTQIISNLSSEILTIAINYNIGILGLIFIIFITAIQLLTVTFYQRNFQNHFSDNENEKLFYALNSLNLFAIIGIFATDNIINLYVLIEIYALTFYSLYCITNNKSLNKLAFRYFIQGSLGSILLLFSFLFLYINFNSANFEEIYLAIQNIYDGNQKILTLFIFIILITGLLIKFFPFWLHYQNLKTRDSLSDFLLSKSLFIKTNIGFYLLLKFLFLLFDSRLILNLFQVSSFFFLPPILLIFFSNYKIFNSKNLRSILFYFCLIAIGFFLICVGTNDENALIASLAFITFYSFAGLIILFICGFMNDNFKSYNLDNFALVRSKLFLAQYLIPILALLLCSSPLTILFLAHWNLLYSLFDSGYFLIILPLFTTSFVFYNLSLRILSAFYFKNVETKANKLKDNIYHLISILLIILVIILLTTHSEITSNIFKNLSSYLK